MISSKEATIFALSSGAGRAGVAVIRISGPSVRAVLVRMAPPELPDRCVGFRRLVDPQTGALLDEAVVLFFAAPRTETGDDVAEFQVHGGRAVVAAVIEALGRVPDCRLAEPGEFARRAFENGKIDLAEAEGLADLIDAETEAQRRQALSQATGALSKVYDGWRHRLIEIAALVEAGIDFSDEPDVSASAFDMARHRAEPLLAEMTFHLDDNHRGEILREGFRVAILGPPNAGKSSLLNALARRDAAIVSSEAGTTRDVVEVRLDLGGYPVIVSDTAGLRDASNEVEREGIRRSLAAAGEANLVLWLSASGSDKLPEAIAAGLYRIVRTKSDLDPKADPVVAISTVTGAGLDRLVRDIADAAKTHISGGSSPALTQTRHRQNLESAVESLGQFLAGEATATELRAEDLRRAAHALGRITGRVDVEDVLDRVFSRVCIGK